MILVRARLRRDASLAALAPLLLPEGTGAGAGAAHRLVWSLFADGPERRRDFLWREEGQGRFLILAAREPQDPHGLFDLECKEFAPALARGDRLGFLLRANPTVQPAAPRGAKDRPPRSDVVMHALHGLPAGAPRAEARPEAVVRAGTAWLERQGAAKGFALEPEQLRVEGYETWRIPRGPGRPPIRYGTLDFAGVLRVEDPARFVAALREGFGRARAFGCGLMLIRRAGPAA